MAVDWILVPCLATLRGEINVLAPGRSKASDGSIGDAAHQDSTSDHNPDETGQVPITDADKVNEVHAIDVDKDLNADVEYGAARGMEAVVQFLLARCRAGAEKRLRYIIFNRRIWSASKDWIQQTYSGSNAHTEHAHFSASYETKHEASTASWHLGDLMAITDDEIERIASRVEERVWNHTEPNPYDNGATRRRVGGEMRMMEYRDDQRAVATNITRLDNLVIPSLGRIETGVAAILGRDFVDEEAVGRAVAGILSPEALAAAVVEAMPADEAEKVARLVDEKLAARLAE